MNYTLSHNCYKRLPAFMDLLTNPCDKVVINDICKSGFGMIWGYPIVDGFSVTSEYGFFFESAWLDRIGIYWDSSLNTEEGRMTVLSYSPPTSIIKEVINSTVHTKYPTTYTTKKSWNGVVLAAQNPMDCSVAYTGDVEFDHVTGYGNYMEWYMRVCEEYGPRLFVKIHPLVAKIPEYYASMVDIAKRYGCEAGVADFTIFDNCEKVITYSSTIILDCWMRDIPVEQHGPGFLSGFKQDEGKKVADFLMWKYCVPLNMTRDDWYNVWDCFIESKDLYPIPESFSWANWFLKNYKP